MQKPATSNEVLLSKLDEKIAKLMQVRELLADTAVLAVVNEALSNAFLKGATTVTQTRRTPKSRRYRGIVQAAYECIQAIGDQPFTKRELADKLRADGHNIRKHRHAVYYAVEKLMTDGVIEVVERGGGKRPNKYLKVEMNRAEPNKDAQGDTPPPEPITLPRGAQFRGTLTNTAFESIEQFNRPFAAHELIQNMTEAGFTFAGNPNISIQPALNKFVKEGFLLVVREQGCEQPALYERRYPE